LAQFAPPHEEYAGLSSNAHSSAQGALFFWQGAPCCNGCVGARMAKVQQTFHILCIILFKIK
jgi:hypothetical protein